MVGGGEMTPEDSQGRLSVEDSSSHVPPAKEPPRLDARESVMVNAVLEKMFEQLRLLSLLKVDPGDQVRAERRARRDPRDPTPPSSLAMPDGARARTTVARREPTSPHRPRARPLPQAVEISRSVGEEISRVMQQQASLEARFEELLGARDALKAMNNKEPYIANQAELRRVASELRATTNRLRSNLQENPDVSDNLAHAHTTRARLMSLVGDLINEIDAEGTWTTLDEMLEEERREDEAREEAFAREREVTAKVKALRTQLVEEKEAHVAYTTEKARLMEGYKEELKEKKGATGGCVCDSSGRIWKPTRNACRANRCRSSIGCSARSTRRRRRSTRRRK